MAPPRPSDVRIEPVPDEPAATVALEDGRALLVADYHAGYEAGLRDERGVDVPSQAPDRRERLLALLERTDADRLVVLGDFMHSIGEPGGAERGELEVLLESLPDSCQIAVIKGNHDGDIESWLPTGGRADAVTAYPPVTVTDGSGVSIDGIGFCHGHTWPSPAVLDSDIVCLGHEHPCVRLEDDIGGSRLERAWLRGRMDSTPFRSRPEYDDVGWLTDGSPPRLIVVPAFNDLVGGTWINRPDQSFLSPFLPAGLADGDAYLLDGTRLGRYQSV
ncbi:metallophosphoesterase [Salinadaptatus halalkaliphilus]|uniref:Metallophosphoesterase n=1 Tax=Salinadaptatus halalkaliphilus TaxID=2419781 RepID=A0A4S3TGP3_9EURY|nr:metallophosphoesterase [Salinadaptatus halalkaliphilus]THE63046.1 metallophosphoesterase [Salinadaptatus halalkaliphilus]